MCSPRALALSASPDSVSCLPSSAASARDDEMPSLQVSVPGHAVMSVMVPAPAPARSIVFSASYTAGRSASLTQRSSMF